MKATATMLVLTAILVAPVIVADVPEAEQATTIETPAGTFYLYAFGGTGFPWSHGWQIWQESNDLAECGVNEGLPIRHGVPTPGSTTALQVRDGMCNGVAYFADTMLTP